MKTPLFKKTVALLAVVAVVAAGLLGCSAASEIRSFAQEKSFSNELSCGAVSIGYPDGFEVITDEHNGIVTFSDGLMSGAPVAQSKGLYQGDISFVLALADEASSTSLDDARQWCKSLEETVGVQNEFGYKRLSASTEDVLVNGKKALLFTTELENSTGRGSSYAKGFVVELSDGSKVVAQLEAYFYGDSYESNAELCDEVIASLQWAG